VISLSGQPPGVRVVFAGVIDREQAVDVGEDCGFDDKFAWAVFVVC